MKILLELFLSLHVPLWLLITFLVSSAEDGKFRFAILTIFMLSWLYFLVIYKPESMRKSELFKILIGLPLFMVVFYYVFSDVYKPQMFYYIGYFMMMFYVQHKLADVQNNSGVVRGFALDASAVLLGGFVSVVYVQGWVKNGDTIWNETFIISITLMIWFRTLLCLQTSKLITKKFFDYLFVAPVAVILLITFVSMSSW